MLYKLFPLDTEPRRCVVAGEEPPPVPKHTPASLAAAVRSAFPEMTVHEPKGKPFIVVQADLPVPTRLFPATNERRARLGHYAVEAICRNENCRAEPVAKRRELTLEEKKNVLERHGLGYMARRLTE